VARVGLLNELPSASVSTFKLLFKSDDNKEHLTCISHVYRYTYRPFIGTEVSCIQAVNDKQMKAARISGCLYNLVWLDKHMSTECKVRIYKTNVRPVLTYASETKSRNNLYPATSLRTAEMKIIRAIHGKTIRDKIRSDQLQQLSGIQDMVKWTNVRRRE
jgi:hypothetical protein